MEGSGLRISQEQHVEGDRSSTFVAEAAPDALQEVGNRLPDIVTRGKR